MNFELEFKPEEVQKYTHELRMSTINNPYENQLVALTGEGFREDIMFEKMPLDKQDAIAFGDCIVGASKTLSFVMRNYTDKTMKF